ncbi:MAG TPA: ATP synthase subunit I [Mariprofundaceae bacterium]|nr:ATP synthase subunit I [Mariprofundaceae bacterium]
MSNQTSFDEGSPGNIAIRLLAMQLGMLLVMAAVFWLLGVIDRFPAFAYGLVLMAANAMVLVRVVSRASRQEARTGQRLLYGMAVARFLAVLALLAVAYRLGLHLLYVAAGMLVAQVAVYITGFRAAYAGTRLNGGSELG